MKIFVNHISRCGGTSLMKYFEEAFDGDLIIINSRLVNSEQKLIQSYRQFVNSSRAIVIGHTHQPSIANRPLVHEFWSKIYGISDIRLSILRNPIERSISWIKDAGGFSNGDNFPDGIPFRFRGLLQDDDFLATCIENQRGSRSKLDDKIYECILPENFYSDAPDNLNIAGSVANYPAELLSSKPATLWLTPLPCRQEKHIKEYRQLFDDGINAKKLVDYLSIPKFEFYGLECIHKLVSSMEDRSITKPGYTVPHINKTTAEANISDHIKRVLTNLFPESYLLWKHAVGIL